MHTHISQHRSTDVVAQAPVGKRGVVRDLVIVILRNTDGRKLKCFLHGLSEGLDVGRSERHDLGRLLARGSARMLRVKLNKGLADPVAGALDAPAQDFADRRLPTFAVGGNFSLG